MMRRALALLLLTISASAGAGPIWDNMLRALFVEGAGIIESTPDPKDGYGSRMHTEPRYRLGVGFAFDVSSAVECDLGYAWQDAPIVPGYTHDPLDKSHNAYVSLRFRPFHHE